MGRIKATLLGSHSTSITSWVRKPSGPLLPLTLFCEKVSLGTHPSRRWVLFGIMSFATCIFLFSTVRFASVASTKWETAQRMVLHKDSEDFQLLIVAPLLPLTNKTRGRQVRAIHSWTELHPAPMIYIAAETESDFRQLQAEMTKKKVDISRIRRISAEWKEFDDPLLVRVRLPTISSMIQQVMDKAKEMPNPKRTIFTYVNSDMYLFEEFTRAARYAAILGDFKRFLVVGERLELFMTDLDEVDTKAKAGSEVKTVPLPALRERTQKDGKWRGRWAVDYFVFGTETWERVPPFIIGRPRFDNWLVANARGVRIDATDTVVAMHQVHDYSHAGAKNTTIREDFKSPIIEEANPGRTYNEEIIERNRNYTIYYREGSLDHLCLKLKASSSRVFCLEKEKHAACSENDQMTVEELSSKLDVAMCGSVFV